jgi:phage shock protein A
MRQARALVSFAKSTNNPELAAVLVERAADLKDQLDEKKASVDPSLQAPDVEPFPN